MNPSWLTVDQARTRFRSFATAAIVAAMNAETTPTATTARAHPGTALKVGKNRASRYTPALTIVAAWISAEMGVGASIASGQPCLERELRRLGGGGGQEPEPDQCQELGREARAPGP